MLRGDLLHSRKSHGTGCVGQVFEVQWLRSLALDEPGRSRLGKTSLPHDQERPSRAVSLPPVTDSTFHLDDDTLEPEVIGDPDEILEVETAENYCSATCKEYKVVFRSFYCNSTNSSESVSKQSGKDARSRYRKSSRQYLTSFLLLVHGSRIY